LFSKGAVAPGAFPSPSNNCSFFGRHHGGVNMDKHASLGRLPSQSDVSGFVPRESVKIR
jgi:hypothetical protein